MMDSDTIKCITPSHETLQGRVQRIVIYLQSKVLEIVDSNGSVFYLLYFRNHLLAGGKLDQINPDTFLYKAFEQGITLDSTHPLFSVTLPVHRKATIPNPTSLFTDLQSHFSLHEISFAATYMDSFIEKKLLIHTIREIFNHFRRNGQLQKAFLTAKILYQFSPETKFVKELMRSLEFEKYRKIEEVNPTALLDQEPIFLESFYMDKRNHQQNSVLLDQLLKQQSRHVERLLLMMDDYQKNHSFSDYGEFIALLRNELKPEDQYHTLKFLWERSPHSPQLTEDLLQEQRRLNLYPEAIHLIVSQPTPFTAAHHGIIEKIFEHVDPSTVSNITNINQMISQLHSDSLTKKEEIVRRFVTYLLKEQTPTQVKEWLEPISRVTPNLQVIREVRTLESLSQDMDQLARLGETYYQLGLFDQSIECFTWEMELKPDSIDPVRWLSKIYQEKGMKEEADGYKKLSVAMAKRG